MIFNFFHGSPCRWFDYYKIYNEKSPENCLWFNLTTNLTTLRAQDYTAFQFGVDFRYVRLSKYRAFARQTKELYSLFLD